MVEKLTEVINYVTSVSEHKKLIWDSNVSKVHPNLLSCYELVISEYDFPWVLRSSKKSVRIEEFECFEKLGILGKLKPILRSVRLSATDCKVKWKALENELVL